jgi:hypothetical protein
LATVDFPLPDGPASPTTKISSCTGAVIMMR